MIEGAKNTFRERINDLDRTTEIAFDKTNKTLNTVKERLERLSSEKDAVGRWRSQVDLMKSGDFSSRERLFFSVRMEQLNYVKHQLKILRDRCKQYLSIVGADTWGYKEE